MFMIKLSPAMLVAGAQAGVEGVKRLNVPLIVLLAPDAE
jgi:hypothetical protein